MKDDDRLAWVNAVRQKHRDFLAKKNNYWTGRIAAESRIPLKLWRSMSKILRREKKGSGDQSASQRHSADAFLRFFDEKVKTVRSSTEGHPPPEIQPTATASLPRLRAVTEEEVRHVIMRSPTKSCILDPVPTSILKESLDILLPFLTAMCNASIVEGHLPLSQRHAIVTPLLKKPSLDPDELKNYRPVSNLTFVSKVVERLVSDQLVEYLETHDLMPRLQSAYRRRHSTETALLRIISDLLAAVDRQHVSLLGLLDLSAAFDCVDHDILLRRLEKTFGVCGGALSWIQSFLLDRTQQVSFEGRLSGIGRLFCGVPQGSVLGPLLFVLYTAEIFNIVAENGLKAHSYADDTQIYVSAVASDAPAAVQRFTSCVELLNDWMGRNRLKMNAEKTQVIWIGTRQQLAKVNISNIQLMSASVAFSETVFNLGVLIDGQLSMADHVAALCRSGFFQLRQLRAVRSSLTDEAARTLVFAFVSSRLDYCNSLLSGIGEGLLSRLQSVQNAAARLVTGTRKYDHITPVLRRLSWLPVRQRISYKIALLMYKCVHGMAPPYLADDCIPLSSLPGLENNRSAAQWKVFRRSAKTNAGKRSFAFNGPTIWNSLRTDLRDPDLSIQQFRGRLKTFLFG